MTIKIGIIGGSGLSKIGIIKNIEEIEVTTPYGKPSEKLSLGTIENIPVVFLPRHGKNHTIPPHKINYQANIFALKECGVEYLISTNAVGSLKKEMQPLDFVIADQLIDRTWKRASTFFEQGIVAHVEFADPFCPILSDIVFQNTKEEGINTHRGTYICMEGPQFSTRAESKLYRNWNVDVIGMTLATEAKLAREAQMCFCGILTVTDYDCWYESKGDVSVISVVEILKKNNEKIGKVIQKIIPKLNYNRTCNCKYSLKHAIISSPNSIEKINPRIKKILIGDD
ncbi:MAG: S-methyl-5'-thioadenosine phosphorylase [Thermoplasmatota archaeon]